MDSSSSPLENAKPAPRVEAAAFAALTSFQESVSAALAAQRLHEIEKQIAPAISTSADPSILTETPGEMPAPSDEQIECVAILPAVCPFTIAGGKGVATDLLDFHGLTQQPFDVTPDPAYLYLSPSHRDALTSLTQGIEHFRGFMMLVAEPGMGKTTLLNKLMEELSDSARVVFLFQTQCSSTELLRFILNELEVDHAGMDVVAMHRALNQALLEEMLRGRKFVLIVDEAQNLQEPVLETIRLLSDFETTHSKLIQIVLAGQPQLADSLMEENLSQLRQRIAVLTHLNPLSCGQSVEYIEHRLRGSGWTGKTLFTSEALALIVDSTGGVPRSINNLCFNAMLMAFDRRQEIIGADLVKEAAAKLNLQALMRRPREENEMEGISNQAAVPSDSNGTAELARVLAAALATDTHPGMIVEPAREIASKHDVVLTGNLTEKVRSQGWNKRHEYRILVTLERDPFSGLPVADRYYCCSIYMDEKQAATLNTGKPVRIKIEQD